jgi:hypothetical protein
MREKSEK